MCEKISGGDHHERNERFEQADRGRRAVLGADQPHPVHIRVDNVAAFIHLRIIQIEYLIEAGVEHVAQAKRRHQHDDRPHPGQRNMPGLAQPARPVDKRRFVERRADTR